jgi:GntR family histidine utilization transcriptional repressor
MTVNKVLTQLAHAGLIERRRKAGSFVKRPHSQSAVLEIKDIKVEVQELGVPYRYEMIEFGKRRSRRADRDKLDLAVPDTILDLVCRHFAGRQPFCLEERLINLTAVPEAASETFAETAPGAWLVSRVPWTTAEHKIRAIGADRTTADLLSIPEGKACLVVERRTWSAERPVTFVRLTYPGDMHEMIARFLPSQS